MQLRDGIRALLIDVHYGMPAGDRVKTLLDDEIEARRKYEAVLGKEGIDAAMRIRDRLVGAGEGKRGVYCATGFASGPSPLIPMLRQIREFLVMNPGEVLMIIIQDEGVTPGDIETCFRESGLIDFVYRRPIGESWPTLRAMVAEDQRAPSSLKTPAREFPGIIKPISICRRRRLDFINPRISHASRTAEATLDRSSCSITGSRPRQRRCRAMRRRSMPTTSCFSGRGSASKNAGICRTSSRWISTARAMSSP